jgi:hypothetical protein
MDFDRFLDRLLSFAPLGVLMYVIRRHETERRAFLEAAEREQSLHRDVQRELINRVVAPHLVPTGTRPVDRRPQTSPNGQHPTVDAEARAAWAAVGTAAPLDFRLPGDGDEPPGQE